MINTILERLFYGDINVNEFFRSGRSNLFKEERKKYKEQEDAFHDKLPSELRKEFDELYTNGVTFLAMENVIYFKEGAKIGAQLLLELLSDSEEYCKE